LIFKRENGGGSFQIDNNEVRSGASILNIAVRIDGLSPLKISRGQNYYDNLGGTAVSIVP